MPTSGRLASLAHVLPHVTQPIFHRRQKHWSLLFWAGSEIPQAVWHPLVIPRVNEIVTTHRTTAILAPQVERAPATLAADPTQFKQFCPKHCHNIASTSWPACRGLGPRPQRGKLAALLIGEKHLPRGLPQPKRPLVTRYSASIIPRGLYPAGPSDAQP